VTAAESVPIAGQVAVRNEGAAAVWEGISIAGVPKVAPAAGQRLMHVRRFFYSMGGQALDVGKLKQNSVFVMVIEGGAEDGQAHQAMLLAGLPAGWEIAGRFASGKPPGMGWLGELSDTAAQFAADDRFAAAIDLSPEHEDFRVGVMLRAVTPGDYELPGAALADMYRPAIFARQGSVRIDVLPP
jgi:alpha-2-macroglobulin